MIFSMGFVVILQVIQVILPRQTLRAIHRDQRQQRAVDASRLSCDHERTPRTAKMMVIGSRRIPPDTLLTKSIHSNIPVTLGLNMCYIYTQVSFHQCKWVWNQQMKLGVQLIIRFHQKTLGLIAQIPSNSWYTLPAVRLLTNMSFAIVAFSRFIVSVNRCISLVRILVPC